MRDRDVIVSNFWLGMLLSVLAHLFLLLVRLNSMEFQKPQIVEELLPIEITELTKIQPKVVPKKQEKQIVETERDGIESLDKDAKFMSDINQKVEKETRAKMIDDFRKKSGTGLKKDGEQVKMAAPPSGEAGKPNSDLEVDDRGGADQAQPTGIKRNWQTLSLKDLSISGDGGLASASDDRLDVAEGERTILSTREFRYFSYYHRIKELLRQYWKPNVERKMIKIYAGGKKIDEKEVVTQLVVLLNRDGSVQKISKISSSGIGELDEAAVEAFQAAGPFPNPPKGIVDPDGFVRIRWDFILTVESSPRIQFQTTRAPGSDPR